MRSKFAEPATPRASYCYPAVVAQYNTDPSLVYPAILARWAVGVSVERLYDGEFVAVRAREVIEIQKRHTVPVTAGQAGFAAR